MNQYNYVVKKSLDYARHNLSYSNMLSCDFGAIIPFYLEQNLVPGDKARISSAILAKFAPFINPVYAEINILTEYYFVPYRILQPNYINTMSGGESGMDYPNRSKFIFDSRGLALYGGFLFPGTLSDYLGINIAQELIDEVRSGQVSDRTIKFTSYAHKAYHMIYNEYYRDQNVQNPVDIPLDDLDLDVGDRVNNAQALALLDIRYSAWKKDYFTSALPFSQRGGSMGIPIDGSGEVYYTYVPSSTNRPHFRDESQQDDSHATGFMINNNLGIAQHQNFRLYATTTAGTSINNDEFQGARSQGTNYLAYDPAGTLRVSMNDSMLLIENLRNASAVQQFLEQKARSGGRDREFLFGQFGVDNKDMRLTIPQLIGGGVQPVVMSEILQQSQSTDTSPQGTRSGDANSFGSHSLFRDFYVTEPGLIMGVLRVVPKSQYMQGLSRHFTKFDWSDDFNPFFQHLGEQTIKSQELYCDGTESDDLTFGYAPRFAEYKWHSGEVHGDFKTSLDSWHLGRIFPTRPVLNENFIQVRPDDANRIFAVQKDDDGDVLDNNRIWLEIFNKANYIRPIMKNAIPQLI